jgi:hypothetical protein
MNSPHIVVFANQEPDYGRLTADRWKLTKLSVKPFPIFSAVTS